MWKKCLRRAVAVVPPGSSIFVASSRVSLFGNPPSSPSSPHLLAKSFCSSSSFQHKTANMEVVPVPVLSDNYAYLLIDSKNKIAAAVDPAEHERVIEAAKREGVEIKAVLTTHHHTDHSGGNKGITKAIEGLQVYGGDDRIPQLTKKVGGGDSFSIGDLHVDVLFTPCHTRGHVLYLVSSGDEGEPKALFSGDTLFIGGCGRFFEGSAEQMHHALCEVVAKLPSSTRVYCGHEYTVKNLEFALTVDKDNQALKEKLEWAKQKRSRGEPTIPSTVEEELSFNPFMRVTEPAIQNALGLSESASPVEVMAALRSRKDHF
ncbi:hydroxyacylglutathione hydrolase [Balamuthia mandrillaris]